MDKAGLFPGEGAAFKLQKTNLPHCWAHPAGAIDVGCFGTPGVFFSQLPTILLPVLVSLAWGGTAAGLEDRFPRLQVTP